MIATQTKIGNIGTKATTELSLSFNSMVNVGHAQFGLDSDGIHILNSGETDNGGSFQRTFTLATNSLGIKNFKRGRFLYIGYEADDPFTVSIRLDNQAWRDYVPPMFKSGLGVTKVPVGRDGYGKYVAIKVTSDSWFRIDSINGLFAIRQLGLRGY